MREVQASTSDASGTRLLELLQEEVQGLRQQVGRPPLLEALQGWSPRVGALGRRQRGAPAADRRACLLLLCC
jgi:hypothetical protein